MQDQVRYVSLIGFDKRNLGIHSRQENFIFRLRKYLKLRLVRRLDRDPFAFTRYRDNKIGSKFVPTDISIVRRWCEFDRLTCLPSLSDRRVSGRPKTDQCKRQT